MSDLGTLPHPHRGVLTFADIDQGADCYSRLLAPCRVSPRGRAEAEVAVAVTAAQLGPVTVIGGYHRGVRLDVELQRPVDHYDAHFSLSEEQHAVVSASEPVRLDGWTASVLSPGMMAAMELPAEYRQLHVRIDRMALERHLERLIGSPITGAIRFEPRMDLRREGASSWWRAVRLLRRELDRPFGLLSSDRMNAPWCEMIMTGLLLAQPNNYSDLLARREDAARWPSPLRRAIRSIEADPCADLRLGDLAARSGCSSRSLQRHFARHVGMPPRDYVEWIRLRRAHEDLRRESRSTTTVAAVAHRWGFEHVSRFAGLYRRRYGQPPSQTLREPS